VAVQRAVARESSRLDLRFVWPPQRAGADAPEPLDEAAARQVAATRRQAEDLFHRLKIAEARQLLENEIQRSADKLVEHGRLSLLRELHLWHGVVLTKQGEEELARAAFSRAILLDQRPMDATRFPPPVIEAHTRAAREFSLRPRGTLHLQVTPRDARVTIDGRLVRATSLPANRGATAVQLSHGEHWIAVEALGCRTAVRRIRVATDEVALRVVLDPASRRATARQLEKRHAESWLELQRRPRVAATLRRLFDVDEILDLREEAVGGRIRLTFARVRSIDGQILGISTEIVSKSHTPAGVRRALSRLWPPRRLVRSSSPWYKRWWVWTAVGCAVAGGTIAVLAATAGPETYIVRLAPR
jgi:hypothetical protein